MLLPRSGKVAMQWDLPEGAVLRYELTRTAQLDLGTRGKTQETLLLGTRMEVQPKDGGIASVRVKVTFDRVKLQSAGIDYDSQRGDRPVEGPARALAGLVGASCQLEIEPTGRIAVVDGLSAIVAGGVKTGSGATGASHLDLPLDDEQFATLLTMVFPRLPDEPVALRATWPSEGIVSLPRLGKLAMKTRSKITTVTERGVSFKTRATLESRDRDSADMHGSAEIWDGSTIGTATWDLRARHLEEATATAKVVAEADGQEFEVLIVTSARWVPKKPD